MSQLLELRAAVIASVKATLPTFDVAGHLGRFAASDLSKFLLSAPAVRVAILGIADGEIVDHGLGDVELDCRARVALYVVTKDQGRASRDEIATAAVEAIMRLAAGANWGLAFARSALPADASNLFSDETLNKGVALWGINIAQPVRLSGPDQTDEGGPLSQLFVGVAPEVGAAHIDDYVGPILVQVGDVDV